MNGFREEDETVIIKNNVCPRCNTKLPDSLPHRCPNCKVILIPKSRIDPIRAAFESMVVPNIKNLLN